MDLNTGYNGLNDGYNRLIERIVTIYYNELKEWLQRIINYYIKLKQ